MSANPFKGLSSYTEEDVEIFKGRSKAVADVTALFAASDVVVINSESGEGKSSLINAGIIPAMREQGYVPVPVIFTEADYLDLNTNFDRKVIDALAEAVSTANGDRFRSLQQLVDSAPDEKWGKMKIVALRDDPELRRIEKKYNLLQNAWWVFRNYGISIYGNILKPFIVFDQFEEVFTRVADIGWTDRFFAFLNRFLTDSCPEKLLDRLTRDSGDGHEFPRLDEKKHFSVLLSLRNEYMGELDYWGVQRYFIPVLKNVRYTLKSLTFSEAEEVLRLYSGFSSHRRAEILRFISGRADGKPRTDLPEVSAMLLSIVATTLSYGKSASDSLDDVVVNFYEHAMESIALSDDIRTAIEKALVDSNGGRVRIKETLLTERIPDAAGYLRRLGAEKIIKTTKIYGENYIELVHDSLAKVIAARLAVRDSRLEQEKLEQEKRAEEAERQAGIQKAARDNSFVQMFAVPLLAAICFYLCENNHMGDIMNGFYNGIFGCMKSIMILLTAFCAILGNTLSLSVIYHRVSLRSNMSYWVLLSGPLFAALLCYVLEGGFNTFNEDHPMLVLMSSFIPHIAFIYLKPDLEHSGNHRLDIRNLGYMPLGFIAFIFVCCVVPAPGFTHRLTSASSAWGVFVIPMILGWCVDLKTGKYPLRLFYVSLLAMCLSGYLFCHTPWIRFIVALIGVLILLPRVFPLNVVFLAKGIKEHNLRNRMSDKVYSVPVVTMIVVLVQLGFNPFTPNMIIDAGASDPWNPMIVEDLTTHRYGIYDSKTTDIIIPSEFDSYSSYDINETVRMLALEKKYHDSNILDSEDETFIGIVDGKLRLNLSPKLLAVMNSKEFMADSVKVFEKKVFYDFIRMSVALSDGNRNLAGEIARDIYNHEFKALSGRLDSLKTDVRYATPEEIAGLKLSVARYLFCGSCLYYVANGYDSMVMQTLKLLSFLYLNDEYSEILGDGKLSVDIPERMRYIMPFTSVIHTKDVHNPQSLSLNGLLLLLADLYSAAGNDVGAMEDSLEPVVVDQRVIAWNEPDDSEIEMSRFTVYESDNPMYGSFMYVTQEIMNQMTNMDNPWLNDFKGLSDLLIYTGIRKGYDMTWAIGSLSQYIEHENGLENDLLRKFKFYNDAYMRKVREMSADMEHE